MVSQNLGDSAFSGALWPCSFDILSGNRNKGEARGSGKVMLLTRALNGEAFSGSAAERRPRSQEDYSLSVGGLACDPSLLRTTLSRAAVSGFGGSTAGASPPAQLAPHLPFVLQLPTGMQQQATLARGVQAEGHLAGL